VVVGIDNQGNFFLNMRPIAKEQLEAQLTAIYAARTEDKVLYFKADVNVKFGKVQEAVEIARRAGVRVLAAVTEDKGGPLFPPTEN
jgi:biopolymer transport protein ExbD